MWERILDAVFPAQCAGCNGLGSGLCTRCLPPRQPVARRLPTLDTIALGPYRGPLRDAVLALKDGRRDVARELGRRLVALAPAHAIFVPVPTSARRLRERGLDGVRAIAETMAGLAPSASVATLLVQCKGDAQRGRSRTARLDARNRFRISGAIAHATEVVLIDDVITTGATLEDCAATLRTAHFCVRRAIAVAVAETDVVAGVTKGQSPWKIMQR